MGHPIFVWWVARAGRARGFASAGRVLLSVSMCSCECVVLRCVWFKAVWPQTIFRWLGRTLPCTTNKCCNYGNAKTMGALMLPVFPADRAGRKLAAVLPGLSSSQSRLLSSACHQLRESPDIFPCNAAKSRRWEVSERGKLTPRH